MAVAIAALALAAVDALASGTPGGISLAPATPSPTGQASPYFTWSVAPGARFSDAVMVSNGSASTVQLSVAAVDGETAKTSGAVYANASDPKTRAGAWITPSVTSLTLAPSGRQKVNFSVAVPTTVVAGDHLAGISFQDQAVAQRQSGQITVNEVHRSVIGALVQVIGPASVHFKINTASISAFAGLKVASVNVGITNDGLLLSHSQLTVTLSKSGYQRTVSRALDTALPGDSMTPGVPWPDTLTAGRYTITVVLTAPGAPTAAYTTTVTVGQSLPGSSTLVAQKSAPSTLQLLIAGLLALNVLAAGGGVAWGRRRRVA